MVTSIERDVHAFTMLSQTWKPRCLYLVRGSRSGFVGQFVSSSGHLKAT
jgi:hypothetical protein